MSLTFEQLSEKLREVQADFVNPFLSALNQTLVSIGDTTASKGTLDLIKANTFNGDTQIYMRVDGAIKGVVILEMPEDIAKSFVSRLLLGAPIVELDDMAKNSLEDFSIRIGLRARSKLIDRGYHANVTSFINFHKPLQFPQDREFIVVPIETEYGQIKVFFNVMKTDSIKPQTTN